MMKNKSTNIRLIAFVLLTIITLPLIDKLEQMFPSNWSTHITQQLGFVTYPIYLLLIPFFYFILTFVGLMLLEEIHLRNFTPRRPCIIAGLVLYLVYAWLCIPYFEIKFQLPSVLLLGFHYLSSPSVILTLRTYTLLVSSFLLLKGLFATHTNNKENP